VQALDIKITEGLDRIEHLRPAEQNRKIEDLKVRMKRLEDALAIEPQRDESPRTPTAAGKEDRTWRRHATPCMQHPRLRMQRSSAMVLAVDVSHQQYARFERPQGTATARPRRRFFSVPPRMRGGMLVHPRPEGSCDGAWHREVV
jgi:hypothetical protein